MELYELYYLLLASYYYQDNDIITIDIDRLFDEINTRYKEQFGIYQLDDNKLFTWLKNKCRYNLLDELLVGLYNRFINIEKGDKYEIDNTDIFFVNNIHLMSKIFEEEINNYNKMNLTKCNNKTKIAKWQVIDTVKDILTELDPSEEWKNIYEQALNNNIIIYLNELSHEEIAQFKRINGININLESIKNTCFFPDTGRSYIILNYEGYLTDISTTIHEIIHYISRYYNNNQKEIPLLRELPSMFYEIYTLKYLYSFGYNQEELAEANINRLTDTYKSIEDIKLLVDYLKILIDKGHLTEEDIINEYSNTYEDNNHKSDKCIHDLIRNPYILFGYYPYIIDNYLATNAINKLSSDKLILNYMKYITEHISSVDEEDVFNIILDSNLSLYLEDNNKKRIK